MSIVDKEMIKLFKYIIGIFAQNKRLLKSNAVLMSRITLLEIELEALKRKESEDYVFALDKLNNLYTHTQIAQKDLMTIGDWIRNHQRSDNWRNQ